MLWQIILVCSLTQLQACAYSVHVNARSILYEVREVFIDRKEWHAYFQQNYMYDVCEVYFKGINVIFYSRGMVRVHQLIKEEN